MTESIGQLDKVSRTVKTAKATVDTMTAGEERHSGRSDPLGRLPTVTISNGTRAGDVSVSSLELQACSCPPRHHISCTVEGRACRLCHCELSRTPAWLASTVVRRQRSLGLSGGSVYQSGTRMHLHEPALQHQHVQGLGLQSPRTLHRVELPSSMVSSDLCTGCGSFRKYVGER